VVPWRTRSKRIRCDDKESPSEAETHSQARTPSPVSAKSTGISSSFGPVNLKSQPRDMGHVSEDAVDPQVSVTARNTNCGNSILLLAASASMHSSHEKWSFKTELIVGLTRCARIHWQKSARISADQLLEFSPSLRGPGSTCNAPGVSLSGAGAVAKSTAWR